MTGTPRGCGDQHLAGSTAFDECAIDPDVRRDILTRLAAIESECEAVVLYACESGSRAWGFESPDSDYDVRFVYVRPRDWYLSFDVERQRDVIERPIVDEIDLNGWDIRKALYLFARTNGALIEWLNSPIRYAERGGFAADLRCLVSKHFNAKALCYHYSNMARRNAREYPTGGRVRLKKYFYVLRPLLAIRHIERGLGVPPVRFEELVDAVAPMEIRPGIARLLEDKRVTSEVGTGRPFPELGRFVEAELARHRDAFSGLGRPHLLESGELRTRLNRIFRDALGTTSATGGRAETAPAQPAIPSTSVSK